MDKNIINAIRYSKWTGFQPNNHLKAINMTQIDSWCVMCTNENKVELGKYFHKFRISCGWSINVDAYYGMENKEPYYGSFNRPLKLILTTKEFYRKIGLINEIQYEIC